MDIELKQLREESVRELSVLVKRTVIVNEVEHIQVIKNVKLETLMRASNYVSASTLIYKIYEEKGFRHVGVASAYVSQSLFNVLDTALRMHMEKVGMSEGYTNYPAVKIEIDDVPVLIDNHIALYDTDDEYQINIFDSSEYRKAVESQVERFDLKSVVMDFDKQSAYDMEKFNDEDWSLKQTATINGIRINGARTMTHTCRVVEDKKQQKKHCSELFREIDRIQEDDQRVVCIMVDEATMKFLERFFDGNMPHPFDNVFYDYDLNHSNESWLIHSVKGFKRVGK